MEMIITALVGVPLVILVIGSVHVWADMFIRGLVEEVDRERESLSKK